MKVPHIAFAMLCLLMVGCSGSRVQEANAKEYFRNLRIHVKPTSRTAFDGILEPKFCLSLTNTGSKTIRRMKIVGDVSQGVAYHDTSVKISKKKIRKNGGEIEIEFVFNKSDKMSDAQILMNRLTYNFTVQEIGF